MELRVLNPLEKSLVSSLYQCDCINITKTNQNDLELIINDKKTLLIGCFVDSQMIACMSLTQLSFITFLIVHKRYCLKDVINGFLDIVFRLCCSSISIKVNNNDSFLFKNLGFVVINQDEEFTMLRYKKEVLGCFTSFQEVYDFVSSQKDRVYSLDNFRSFMKRYGDIQNHLLCVHIGGTNGKGSTTNYIREVLQNESYNVGTLTSPALYSRLDVIRINNKPLLEDKYVQYANCYMDAWIESRLSMFEIEVFIAILYFIEYGVDLAVFEVGLGGEFDATNIITPIISAITNIGLDHVEYLGDTYEKIAKTKAGIIKKDKAFITFENKSECLDVFKEVCQKQNALYLQIDTLSNQMEYDGYIEYDYRNFHIRLNTPALYQCQNSALALEILCYLRDKNIVFFDDTSLLNGLKNALWQGRFETVCEHPLIIVDGAHNKEGVEAFCKSIKKYQNIKIIFSALKDKDTYSMIENLLSVTDDVTVCEFDFYRAQSAECLAQDFPVKIEKDWRKAVDLAFDHNGVTFITGSLYFISQVRPYIFNKQKFK